MDGIEVFFAALLDGVIDKYTWGVIVANKYFFGSLAVVAWQIVKYRAALTPSDHDDALVKRFEERFPFLK